MEVLLQLQLGNLLIAANLGLLVTSYILKEDKIITQLVGKSIFYVIGLALILSSVLTLASSDYWLYNTDVAGLSFNVIFWSYEWLSIISLGLIYYYIKGQFEKAKNEKQTIQDLEDKFKTI
jgi:hypothetical protein